MVIDFRKHRITPCPFCGLKPALTTKKWNSSWPHETHNVAQLECEPCGVKMRHDHSNNLSMAVKAVIEQWKTRTSPAHLNDLSEAVEYVVEQWNNRKK